MSFRLLQTPLSVAVLIALASSAGDARAEALAHADPGADPSASAEATGEPGREARVLDEAISVTAARGTAADEPSALATNVLRWQDEVASPIDFQDLVVRVPGVSVTGQNGIFETFSIRGSGGNGILVLVGGMPITAQRRAGVPVAFVEPGLLGEINVTRGPATVHFGPGALGGAISIEPRWFQGTELMGGYVDSGDEYTLLAGYGTESFSIGAARHQSNDTESANGTPLNNSFERDSLSLQFRQQFGDFNLDGLLLPSRTDNIGKGNSRFPVRDTTYPEDDHTVARLRLSHANGFQASVHAHDQSLLTYNQRPGAADTFAYVESLDVGATLQQTYSRDSARYNFGLEFLGRRDVTAFDASRTFESNRRFSLTDAKENNLSLFAIGDWTLTDTWALEAGARISWIEQEQAGADSNDHDAGVTVGLAWTPVDAHRVTLNLASGYRFATLEERFFSGVTPQGEIVGNPNLSSESSLGLDLGHAWQAGDWTTEVHLWRTDVDDLIQLFAIASGVNGYTNVGEAQLWGVDGAVGWTPTENLVLRASLTHVRSKDERSGDPLYGSPPLTAALELKYDLGDFTIGTYYSHRWRVKRPGFEEVARDAVDTVDADLTWHATPDLDLQVFVRNAFNEDYFATSDVLSALAPERAVGFNVIWRPQGF